MAQVEGHLLGAGEGQQKSKDGVVVAGGDSLKGGAVAALGFAEERGVERVEGSGEVRRLVPSGRIESGAAMVSN